MAFVGAGPGDEGLLTLRAAELLAQADLVVGRPELTGPLAHRLPERRGYRRAGRSCAPTPASSIEAANAGQLAVRLFPGDPLLFSRASQQADACARARVRVEIVPGVSAATGVPAFAGIPLTADTGGLRVVHASDLSGLDGPTPGSLVVLGAEAGPVDIAKMLVAAGWADTTPVALTWNGTTTDQHTVVGRLGIGRRRPQGRRGEHADRARARPWP